MPGSSAQDYVRTHGRKVGMLMSADVVSIAPGASLAEAANLMQQHRVKRLPVIENGRLVGVLARSDLLRVLADALKPHPAPSDPELKARIESELRKQAWIPKANIKADVDCGSVAFSGVVTDLRQRDALRVLAEAAGAKSVRSNIICIDPVSGAALD
jgi:CBS-domain-containing membrane protein